MPIQKYCFSVNGQRVPRTRALAHYLAKLGYTSSRGPTPGKPSLMPFVAAVACGDVVAVNLADDMEYGKADAIRELAAQQKNAVLADLLTRFALALELAGKVSEMSD